MARGLDPVRCFAFAAVVATAAIWASDSGAIGLPAPSTARELPPPPKAFALPPKANWHPGVVVRGADGALRLAPSPIEVAALHSLPPRVDTERRALASRGAIAAYVRGLAPRYGLDPELVLAVIEVESNFDSRAVSPRGARGLMQLIPATARRFGVDDSLDPEENIRGGMSYLRWLLSYFGGNLKLTLAAYNAGEGAVDRVRGIPPFAETRTYVARILARYERVQRGLQAD